MDVRLVQLLASFIRVSGDYALARLEFSVKHPDEPAPPMVDRPPDASEHTLRERWPAIEVQLEEARRFAKHLRDCEGSAQQEDTAAGWVARTVQELDQYARAIRWVFTVTEK
jgi:hypothetical protein